MRLSLASPPVRWNASGKPSKSVFRWILLENPPRERPRAWFACPLLRPPPRHARAPRSNRPSGWRAALVVSVSANRPPNHKAVSAKRRTAFLEPCRLRPRLRLPTRGKLRSPPKTRPPGLGGRSGLARDCEARRWRAFAANFADQPCGPTRPFVLPSYRLWGRVSG